MQAGYNDEGKFEREYWLLIKALIDTGKAKL